MNPMAFYYDQILDDGKPPIALRTRSLVGLLPLIAVVELLDEKRISALPGFRKRMDWFLTHRDELAKHVSYCERGGEHGHRLLAIPSATRLRRLLSFLLDESEFLVSLWNSLAFTSPRTKPILIRHSR